MLKGNKLSGDYEKLFNRIEYLSGLKGILTY